jgi:tRNA threonylcarbamoyladenosine biosynthesis protein TsaB
VLILSLDTTTRAGSAALVLDGRVLAVFDGDATRTHGERLPGELVRVLEAAGVSLHDVDLLAVASGPGAFTGLRIGLASMQGVAMAANRPVIGVSALEALAVAAFDRMQVETARVGGWMDAARGEVFAALYDVHVAPDGGPASHAQTRLTEVAGPVVGPPDQVWADWESLRVPGLAIAGDGAVRYAAALGKDVRVLPPPALAPAIARLAFWTARAGGAHPPHQLRPLYVRRPDIGRP